MRDFFGAGFHAVQKPRVLVQEEKEECRAEAKAGEMPFLGTQRAQPADRANGGEEREAADESSDPATLRGGPKIFWQQGCGAEADQVKLQQQAAISPDARGFARAQKLMANCDYHQKGDHDLKIEIAFTKYHELVGAIPVVKRKLLPIRLIGGATLDIPVCG